MTLRSDIGAILHEVKAVRKTLDTIQAQQTTSIALLTEIKNELSGDIPTVILTVGPVSEQK